MALKLDMLYSTQGDRIYNLIENLPKVHQDVSIIIVHQNSNVNLDIYKLLNDRSDVKYFQIKSTGVTKSRNYALSKASSDIVLFCDDDVIYSDDFFNFILGAYLSCPEASVITFAYSTPSKGVLSKFKQFSFQHSLRSILSCGTIEVSAKLSDVKKYNILFPENLGAGTKYFCCDEPVFLGKFINAGLSAYYYPLEICSHPDVSSGLSLDNIDALLSRFIAFRYIFGKYKGYILYILFLFKNIRSISYSVFFKAIHFSIKKFNFNFK